MAFSVPQTSPIDVKVVCRKIACDNDSATISFGWPDTGSGDAIVIGGDRPTDFNDFRVGETYRLQISTEVVDAA